MREIESIRLRNFKIFQNVTMKNIPRFSVLVGANGSGKSTFFEVLGFLKDCLTFTVGSAVQSRGGYRELVSRDHEDENIGIELKFRTEIGGVKRRVTYYLEISNQNGKIQVAREILRYKIGAYGSPKHFLDFSNGQGTAVVNEEDFSKTKEKLNEEYQELDRPDILAIKGLGQFQKFRAAKEFRQLIENWHVSDFHINLARGSKDAAGFSEHLSPTGENLQLVAHRLFQEHPNAFRTIMERMKNRIPGISGVEPEPTKDGRLLLKFQDGSFKDPFIDKYVSDGTIKMFAYLLLLHDPAPHPLLCVEEPENQLYPSLLWELAEEFRDYARRGGQVLVSTHSPDFLNAVRVDEVFWLVKKDGFSQIRRATDDPQIVAFMEEGDQMGYLWKQGFFPEVDP